MFVQILTFVRILTCLLVWICLFVLMLRVCLRDARIQTVASVDTHVLFVCARRYRRRREPLRTEVQDQPAGLRPVFVCFRRFFLCLLSHASLPRIQLLIFAYNHIYRRPVVSNHACSDSYGFVAHDSDLSEISTTSCLELFYDSYGFVAHGALVSTITQDHAKSRKNIQHHAKSRNITQHHLFMIRDLADPYRFVARHALVRRFIHEVS